MMRNGSLRMAAGLLAVFGVGIAGLARAESPDEIIAARQAGYKHIGQIAENMKKAVDADQDVTQFAGPAHEIGDWARKVPTLFPPGTETGHGTHALPAIWTDRDTFNARAASLATEADKLQAVAQTGDKAAFKTQYGVMGSACGACHRQFRARLS